MSDSKMNHIMRKVFYPLADGFIHQTHMVRDYLRMHEGVRCKDVVIPNPLWIKEYPERHPIGGRIIAVGRLADQKNYEGMLRAFSIVLRECPDATLHIYCLAFVEVPPYPKSASSVKDIPHRNFEGNSKNIIKCYQLAEVFVMSSHGEGYPNALMESLAMGVPSVSYDCPAGGPKDMIKDGINGYLIKQDDEDLLASRIIELLKNPEKRQFFSENAKKIRMTNQFDLIYDKYMDFINSCI